MQELRHSSAPAGLAFGLAVVKDEVAELRTEMGDGFAAVNGRLDTLTADVNGRLDALTQAVQRLADQLS